MRTAFLIAGKDLRQRLRDKSAFIYGLIAPLGLAFIFSMIMNPIQNSTFTAQYVVVDQDGGPISQAFGQTLDGLTESGGFTIRKVKTVAEARKQVETGSDAFAGDDEKKADAAFVIPAGLSQSVQRGEGGEITVIGAAGSDLAAQVAYSVAKGFASEIGAVEVAVRTAAHGGSESADPRAIAALQQAAVQTKNPVSLKDVSATTKQLSQTTYMAAGMAIFFLFFTVSFGVSGILEERRIGTMDRLLAAPISPTSIIMGKALTSFVLGITSMTVLVIASSLMFGAEWGNPIGVGMLIVAATISAMGILFIVAAAAKTQDQAGSFQAIIALVLAFLGGTFFSISQAGGFLATLSLITPHAWFLRGLGDLQGGDLSAVYLPVAMLLAFGFIAGAIAWPFLRRAVTAMKVLAIALTSVRRLFRERTNIFFVFILPMLLILILGAAFGGGYDSRVGIVAVEGGELGRDLTRRIEAADGVDARSVESRDAAILMVERGQLEAAVILPEGYDAALRQGESVTVTFVSRTDASAQALRNTVDSAITEQGSVLRAAAFARSRGVGDFDQALATAEEISSSAKGLRIEESTVGEPFVFTQLGRFQLGAYTQLILFTFLTSMTASTALIQSRQLGVSRRMVSTPTPVRTILAGEALGRFGVAMVQGLLIIVGTSVFFGVEWGDPIGAAAIFLLFALGASGVGMLMGAVFNNDQQAGGIGVMLGIGLGALGGCMIPLTIMKIFSPTLYQVAHITPHAWANEGFETLILHNGTIGDITLELGVLAAFATVVFALGAWRLRVSLTR